MVGVHIEKVERAEQNASAQIRASSGFYGDAMRCGAAQRKESRDRMRARIVKGGPVENREMGRPESVIASQNRIHPRGAGGGLGLLQSNGTVTAWRYKPQNAATRGTQQSAQGCSQGEMRDPVMGVGRILGLRGVGVVECSARPL
jgi:hypothetical protein